MVKPIYEGEEEERCYLHPSEAILGICPYCLRDRLLILAAQRAHSCSSSFTERSKKVFPRKSSPVPHGSAFGSLLQRLDVRHRKPDVLDSHSYTPSLEDSFISIKFEKGGCASWDTATDQETTTSREAPSLAQTNYNISMNKTKTKTIIEHPKPRSALRWRKKIGYLFQLMRWKRSNKMTNASKGDPSKAKRNWMRTLSTRKKTVEEPEIRGDLGREWREEMQYKARRVG